jgi:putative phosphoesterase
MKIAILSDIHSNQYALEKVCNYLKKRKIKKIIILGDLVGYYYGISEVFSLINDFECRIIKGNHEEILLNLFNKNIEEDLIRNKYGSGHFRALEALSNDDLNSLFNLPENIEIKINEKKILLCHSNPLNDNSYLYSNSTENEIKKLFIYKHDIVIFGHSHYSFFINYRKFIGINTGSVGQSRESPSLISFIIMDDENMSFEFIKLDYNKKKLIEEIKKYDKRNEYLINVLMR